MGLYIIWYPAYYQYFVPNGTSPDRGYILVEKKAAPKSNKSHRDVIYHAFHNNYVFLSDSSVKQYLTYLINNE